jgi:large conductance mechanosensitive channel
MDMLREFKAFVLRGNVIDLAVAVVLGIAFGALVTALVNGILMQLIAAIFGKPNFGQLTFTIHNATFAYGAVINAVINLLSVAAALFFFVVKPMNWLVARSRREPPADPDTRNCDQCLSVVPAQARRCAYCTSELTPA